MIESKRAYDIVYLALREIGIVSLGDSIAPDVAQEALLVLNSIRAGYSLTNKADGIYDEVYTVTENRQFIELGVGGDIPTRPARITHANIIMGGVPGGVNMPIPVKAYSLYREIAIQTIFAIPQAAFVDTGYPKQKLWFFPGLSNGYSVRVLGKSYVVQYEYLDDPLIDPPEYFSVMYLDLALRLAPKYGVDLPPDVYAQLKSALEPIKANNFRIRMRQMPSGLKSGGAGINFWSGMPNG